MANYNSAYTGAQIDAAIGAVAGKVTKTGNETISGVKSFSSFPVTPSSAPTSNYQVANKKYVDDNTGGGSTISISATEPATFAPGDMWVQIIS